ncbi:hypothetical protein XENTR_v10009081 [Xenopus tropicalis]|uniref:Endonuclease 8-like 1 n=1 Tax=Xenopus tropicalis TaxID=8364 RepID=B1H3L2_XENTR|nr:endonuclease 8-like 1 [Xenopus tropicalis]XP_012821333.2 endonuclease 8-like 1 isoform X1 [Xenopus tropicalis]XP_012821334.2 endonuclease 8-like 1 isoform X1 [Xenopus tropicalis]XP_012821336.2 endonuclease 8-like 1 isoform X1 [Xenopus tropicalis]AAI61437.1 LOC100124806 protein [Xenopus tropicalis]KAE8617455.1 hypothetical protein XENTR_v10009081 [Xenopus tropicalis]KAE8617456.1 hypothetical protein XENTR_v10009081 [Xenopus tropicalis]|eukprot:NP_001116270.1 endonuclease 8-like 1 [Xenopus tropicalis]
MPEGPELHLASLFVNKVCNGLHFAGAVEKSAVSKNTDVPFNCPEYTISSVSRGKEVKLILTPLSDGSEETHIIFRFGMSGSFKFTPPDQIPKHAHLRFYTKDAPCHVLSFVDPRRFGTWVVHGSWQPERGPCVMQEYEKFRENVLKNLSDKVFDKPICEVMLNQKYFNGIGNYLRAEILFRLAIPPFIPARSVLEAVKYQNQNNELSLSKKIKIKKENPDILHLCHLVPLEVINLGGKGYDPEHSDNYSEFEKWLRCYFVPGMKSLRDSNGRTIWFQGDPGPLAPKGKKTKKRQSMNKVQKPLKVKKTAIKGKLGDVKKEKNEDIERDLDEVKAVKAAVKSRGHKTKDGVMKKGVEVKQKWGKGKEPEKQRRVRKVSSRTSALNPPARPLRERGVQGISLPATTRPSRLKSGRTSLTQDSPMEIRRSLRKHKIT